MSEDKQFSDHWVKLGYAETTYDRGTNIITFGQYDKSVVELFGYTTEDFLPRTYSISIPALRHAVRTALSTVISPKAPLKEKASYLRGYFSVNEKMSGDDFKIKCTDITQMGYILELITTVLKTSAMPKKENGECYISLLYDKEILEKIGFIQPWKAKAFYEKADSFTTLTTLKRVRKSKQQPKE